MLEICVPERFPDDSGRARTPVRQPVLARLIDAFAKLIKQGRLLMICARKESRLCSNTEVQAIAIVWRIYGIAEVRM